MPSKSVLEPPEEVTTEAAKGFVTGVARFGSVSLLAHLALTIPLSPSFSARRSVQIYRNLTPQFKTYLQISAMMLGGCIWAERRVTEYRLFVKRRLRVQEMERRREELIAEINEP